MIAIMLIEISIKWSNLNSDLIRIKKIIKNQNLLKNNNNNNLLKKINYLFINFNKILVQCNNQILHYFLINQHLLRNRMHNPL
jgi:hypothetical protein